MPFPILARAVLALAAPAALLAGCTKHKPAEPPPPAASTASAGGEVNSDNVPPALVGTWASSRDNGMRCIELHADGSYLMVPNEQAGDRAFVNYQGTWRVDGHQITWRDTSQGGKPDVNPMEDESPGHFTTVEANHTRTVFERIAGPGSTCPRS